MAFTFECIRDSQRAGDFAGYVNAGNAVLNGTPIYADFLNTWPPFFSIFAVPLSLLDSVSPVLIRSIWLLAIGFAWLGILRISCRIFLDKILVFKAHSDDEIAWTDWRILLPFLLVFRFIIDDLSNIQINSILLLTCLFILDQVKQGKHILPALLMGLIVSLKVYPIFLLFFLFWKQLWKVSLFSIGFILAINGLSFLVFGLDLGVEYYTEWFHYRLGGPIILHHKNQSIFPLVTALLSDVSRGFDIKYNLASLNLDLVKKISAIIVVMASAWPLWNMRGSLKSTSAEILKWQWAIALGAIPLFSPLAWKYYFVFLFPLFLQLIRQFKKSYSISNPRLWLFYLAAVLLILTTDGIIGVYYSDLFEVFACISVGTILLLLLGLLFHGQLDRNGLPKEESV